MTGKSLAVRTSNKTGWEILRDYGGPHDMMQDGKGNTPPEVRRQMQASQKGFGRPDQQMRRNDLHMPPLFFGQVDIIAAIVAFLMIGMNLGIKLYFKNDSDDKRMQVLERQNLKQQLEYLKYQINPHFFMNTLNNIHALVDIDPEKAKATIVELSKMMRYLLYEGNNSLIPLQREIQFLHNYITLMRLRYTDKVTIKTDVPEQIPEKQIPPLLLITFIENAFKHGVSYQQDSYINIGILFSDDRLHFECTNSKHPQKQSEQGGVGLTNVKRRLALIYGSDYTLDINDGDDVYEVKLDIPLNRTA
jgi:LytS/YehU family sensor histidine kinase